MADGYRFRVSPPSVYTEINGGQKSVEDLAELLQLDFEKITLKIVNSYDFATDVLKYSSSYGARRRTSYYEDRGQAFPDDLFPNIQTVFADEIDKTSVVNTMTNSGSSVYEEKYSRNNLERAKQQRVFNYFYNEVDYTKEDSFDLFLAYLKKTNDINYKSLSKIDSLSFEQIQKIVTELKSAKNTFEDINLFIKFPKLSEQIITNNNNKYFTKTWSVSWLLQAAFSVSHQPYLRQRNLLPAFSDGQSGGRFPYPSQPVPHPGYGWLSAKHSVPRSRPLTGRGC